MSEKYTIKEVLQITNKLYANRFTYKERDVVKRINIKEVKEVERHDIPGEPRVYTKYVIESKSWPQYPPYRPRSKTNKQRRISHHYDVVFEMDRLSLNTKSWTSRVGSGKKWKSIPPQSQIKTLYSKTKNRFRRKAKGDRQEYRRLVERHKKSAQYLDVGDYNSRTQGLNGDWIFRCDYAYYAHGHRFGKNYYGNVSAPIRNPNSIVFFTKHQLNVIDQLMKKGILKDD